MKTISYSAQRNILRQLIAGLALSVFLFVSGSAAAQTGIDHNLSLADNTSLHTHVTDKFKLVVFPVAHSQIMKVALENPAKEKLTVLIKNSDDQVVFSKKLGAKAVFIGTFDVTNLADGNYTIVVESGRRSYANPFSLQTQQERIAKAF